MIAEDNRALVERYFGALSGKDKPLSVIHEYVGPEDPSLVEHIAAAESAFAHYELVSEAMIADGDLVAVRGRLRGAHTGDFMGVPATGRSFDVALYIIYRVVGNKIVEHWMLTDNLALMQQLGIVAAPEARA